MRNHENSNVHTVNIRDYNEEIVDFQLDTELIVNCMNEKDNNKDDFVVERSNGKFSLFCMISIVLIIFVIILVSFFHSLLLHCKGLLQYYLKYNY